MIITNIAITCKTLSINIDGPMVTFTVDKSPRKDLFSTLCDIETDIRQLRELLTARISYELGDHSGPMKEATGDD